MIVPLPFSKALFLYGPPMSFARDANLEDESLRLAQTLHELEIEAERLVNER
jgi:lysophospholipid acyltransferase (LPLAT)-like uncharacterized protein